MYKKLSEQVEELTNPQRSDQFVKRFREAVRRGEFDAMYLQERFTMPKKYNRRGAEGTYQRDTKDMLFEETEAFKEWFKEIDEDLGANRRSVRIKASLEAVVSGEIDFKEMAEKTRKGMQASFEKGQALGNSRAKKRK